VIGRFALTMVGLIYLGAAYAGEVREAAVSVRGEANQTILGDGNAATSQGISVGRIENSQGNVVLTNIPEGVSKTVERFIAEMGDARRAQKPATELAQAQLALLLDQNPTEVELVRAKLGKWVGVDGPTLDIGLRNVTERTALDIKMDLWADGNRLKLKRPFPGSFAHYSLRGGVQRHLPIARIEDVEDALGIVRDGFRVVAAGVSPNSFRDDCGFGEYAIGPDMPCRALQVNGEGVRVVARGVALRLEYRDVFGGRHSLLTGVYIYMQPIGQVDGPIMTFPGG
jgi:hypothetical protein